MWRTAVCRVRMNSRFSNKKILHYSEFVQNTLYLKLERRVYTMLYTFYIEVYTIFILWKKSNSIRQRNNYIRDLQIRRKLFTIDKRTHLYSKTWIRKHNFKRTSLSKLVWINSNIRCIVILRDAYWKKIYYINDKLKMSIAESYFWAFFPNDYMSQISVTWVFKNVCDTLFNILLYTWKDFVYNFLFDHIILYHYYSFLFWYYSTWHSNFKFLKFLLKYKLLS